MAKENVIEFLRDEKTATVTLSQGKYISKVLKLKEKFPDEVKIIRMPEWNDGYLLAEIPTSYIKLNHAEPRELTEEQKEQGRERLRNFREQRIIKEFDT